MHANKGRQLKPREPGRFNILLAVAARTASIAPAVPAGQTIYLWPRDENGCLIGRIKLIGPVEALAES